MKQFKVKTFDGETIPATLNEPTQGNTNKTVILIHGIFSTKEEGGRFLRQEAMLLENGFRVIRYDHRGHGEHPVSSEKMTICDTVTDFNGVVEKVTKVFGGNTYIVASSYGAAILLLAYQLREFPGVNRIVFLNPVVDFYSTFVDPIGQQIKEIFTKENLKKLKEKGKFIAVNNITITLSFFNELQLLRPYLSLKDFSIALRVIHGSNDTAVSCEVCKKYCSVSKDIDFITIIGANHAFTEPKYEKESFNRILEFLS